LARIISIRALDRRHELITVERTANRAVRAHALGDLQSQIARDEGLGLGGALALDERVGEERRRVHDAREVPRV
jgi:hypothetical protein